MDANPELLEMEGLVRAEWYAPSLFQQTLFYDDNIGSSYISDQPILWPNKGSMSKIYIPFLGTRRSLTSSATSWDICTNPQSSVFVNDKETTFGILLELSSLAVILMAGKVSNNPKWGHQCGIGGYCSWSFGTNQLCHGRRGGHFCLNKIPTAFQKHVRQPYCYSTPLIDYMTGKRWDISCWLWRRNCRYQYICAVFRGLQRNRSPWVYNWLPFLS